MTIMNKPAFNCLCGFLGFFFFQCWFWTIKSVWGWHLLGVVVLWCAVMYFNRNNKRW